VDLTTLNIQQLSEVKKQLDEELEHLSQSFGQLRQARTKFSECIKSINDGCRPEREGRSILVPLTSSLYVPGTLKSAGKVLVDVGTGYYIEKSSDDAVKFYHTKAQYLDKNMLDLEKLITAKASNAKVVSDVLQQKLTSSASESA